MAKLILQMVDTQIIELMGQNRLTNELMHAGIEVARPERDRGIDLIAYADTDTFFAIPIQMKAATKAMFSIDKKYEKFPNLLMVFLWYIHDLEKTEIYALTYEQSLQIATEKGWTTTSSWIDKGKYSTSAPDKKLRELLLPYKMTLKKWKELFIDSF